MYCLQNSELLVWPLGQLGTCLQTATKNSINRARYMCQQHQSNTETTSTITPHNNNTSHHRTDLCETDLTQHNNVLTILMKDLRLDSLPDYSVPYLLHCLFKTHNNPLVNTNNNNNKNRSFFENKHGFPEFPVLSQCSSYQLGHFQSSILQSTWIPASCFRQPHRGFKTRRTKTRPFTAPSMGQEGFKIKTSPDPSKATTEQSIKELEQLSHALKHIHKGNHGLKSEEEAFTKGFLANNLLQKNTTSTASTWWTNIQRVFMAVFGIFVLWYIFMVINTQQGMIARVSRYGDLDGQVGPVQYKNVRFSDVKGVDEAKEELEDVVRFLKDPEKFTKLGGKLPRGLLLVGEPGTGKTLLAKAVAGEADVPFFYASGSEFDEVFVGVGASRVRSLFKEAKASAPCVIFVDELDAIGGKRVDSPLHPYSRQTINQLLAELDGFRVNEGVIVIGATNFPEALDKALIRPGRFDMTVTVHKPDVRGREQILNLYLDKVKVVPNVDVDQLARSTVGFTGAELENLVNQAALKAASDNKQTVTMEELDYAKDKIMMGPERKSAVIDTKTKRITAFHESGHALVAFYTPNSKSINKATIMPRGPSLGHVSLMPEKDQWNVTKSQLLAQIDVCMGGRVAEEMIFGPDNVTTGAGSDLQQATRIADQMVKYYGMSDKIGMMTCEPQIPGSFNNNQVSAETQALMETEVRQILKDSYERVKSLMKTRSKEHKLLAEALIVKETLTAQDISDILNGNINNVVAMKM